MHVYVSSKWPVCFFTALACWNSGKFLSKATRGPHAVSDTWVSDIRIHLIIRDSTLTSSQKSHICKSKIQWGHKIHIFGRPFLGRSYHILSLYTAARSMVSSREIFLKKPCNLWLSVSFPCRCYISNWVNIGVVVFEMKMLRNHAYLTAFNALVTWMAQHSAIVTCIKTRMYLYYNTWFVYPPYIFWCCCLSCSQSRET